MKLKSDHRSNFSNLSSWELKKPEKKNRTGIAEVTGSNPVEALIFFFFRRWKIYCDDLSSVSSTTAVQIWIISYILHVISLLTGRYELNEVTSLPMCGFIAQLVEHRTGIAEVTGANPVEALFFFFQASSSQLLKLENLLRWSLSSIFLNIPYTNHHRISR